MDYLMKKNKQTDSHKKITKSLSFQFMQNISIQIASFIFQIILARILDPNDYGILSIVLIFINFANVFISSGYGNSLIQKTESDIIDFSTMFIFSFCISIFFSIVIFLFAGLISSYYEISSLCNLIKASVIMLPLCSINSIYEAYSKKNMQFKLILFGNIASLLISWVIGILLAYNGFGVWALLLHQIIYKLLLSIYYIFVSKLKIKLIFSIERLKILLKFGSKLLFASIITTIYEESRSLVIGKKYSSDDLGYFNRGKQFPYTITLAINQSVQSVMYSVFSKEKNDEQFIKTSYRNTILLSTFIVFPICVGLMVIAKPMIIVLLTSKWLQAVPFLIVFCIYYMMWPLRETSQQLMSSLGRSDLYLKLEIIEKIIGILIIIFTMFINVYAIAIGLLIDGLISMLINIIIVGKLIDFSFIKQLKVVVPNFLLSILMGMLIYPISCLLKNNIILLVIQVLLGIVFYFILSIITRNKAINIIKEYIKEMKERKKTTV